MFTGTPEQLAAAQLQAAQLAEQIADLLNQLDAIHPGSTSGQVVFLGGDIHARGGHWTTYTD
ncbi:hypothetical protein ABH930_006393 [Kitasatospora sp. GAS204A]|uniref:hypothetical protein n=1 Tax=unclassified Kitasatospora TaxID=2633591 RepID=UPI002475E2E4|nr:hypothetical protein [Kitasatospora sp. GAS204B]MDH6122015.1 hypothetical protein [Kitasatospora sp. GAS204B]